MKTGKKNMSAPDETRSFPKGKLEVANLEGTTFGRITFEPGWKWSECVGPIMKTKTCQAMHTEYHVSGKLHVVMNDGAEFDLVAGDVAVIQPGHDAWVVGNESVVAIDFTGMTDYAKKA